MRHKLILFLLSVSLLLQIPLTERLKSGKLIQWFEIDFDK